MDLDDPRERSVHRWAFLEALIWGLDPDSRNPIGISKGSDL